MLCLSAWSGHLSPLGKKKRERELYKPHSLFTIHSEISTNTSCFCGCWGNHCDADLIETFKWRICKGCLLYSSVMFHCVHIKLSTVSTTAKCFIPYISWLVLSYQSFPHDEMWANLKIKHNKEDNYLLLYSMLFSVTKEVGEVYPAYNLATWQLSTHVAVLTF